jgi:hypothetical protein
VANQPEYFSQDYDEDDGGTETAPAPRRAREPDPPLHPAAAAVAGGCLLAGAAMVLGTFAFISWRVFRCLDLFFS